MGESVRDQEGLPSLVELALSEAVQNVESLPFRAEEKLKPEVASACFARLPLPTSDNVSMLATHVDSDEYWKRACSNKACKNNEHGLSRKSTYFELHLQELLAGCEGEQAIVDALQPFADCVHTLRLSGAQSKLPLDVVCSKLPNLMSIELKHAQSVVESLPAALASISLLTTLSLAESKLSDEDVELILGKLAQSPTLLHLDLSHNKIGPKGARLICESLLLSADSVLTSLDLSGNLLRSDGASAIGQSLAENESLLSLSLRLNTIGDGGGVALCKGLAENSTLRQLHLSANKLGSGSTESLLKLLDGQNALETISLTSNVFAEEDLARLSLCNECFVDVRSITEPAKATNASLASETPA